MADLEIVRPVVARHQLADVVQSCRRSTETFYNPIRVIALMIAQPSVVARFKSQLVALNSEPYSTVTNITFYRQKMRRGQWIATGKWRIV
jgi:hypothetical protein